MARVASIFLMSLSQYSSLCTHFYVSKFFSISVVKSTVNVTLILNGGLIKLWNGIWRAVLANRTSHENFNQHDQYRSVQRITECEGKSGLDSSGPDR